MENRWRSTLTIPHNLLIKAMANMPDCAASILAKVYRDNMMQKLAAEFPHYLWKKNAAKPIQSTPRKGIKNIGRLYLGIERVLSSSRINWTWGLNKIYNKVRDSSYHLTCWIYNYILTFSSFIFIRPDHVALPVPIPNDRTHRFFEDETVRKS